MIGNITRGNNFRGLLEYLLYKEKSYCLDSNIELPREKSLLVPQERYLVHQYAYQFNQVATQKPELKRPVYHVSLSLPPGEHLTDEQWKQVGDRYLQQRGFGNCQYVLVRHNDRGHEHCHIVTSRVDRDGQVVEIDWDYYKSQEVIRPIERDYNLTQIENSWECDRSQRSQAEIQLLEIKQEPSVRRTLQQTIDRIAAQEPSMVELVEQLSNEGIKVQTHQRGETQIGISYQLDGISYPGYKLGKAYSFPGLQKHRGISFDRTQTKELINIAARSQQNEVKLEKTSELEINHPPARESIAVKEKEEIPQPEAVRLSTKTMAIKNFDVPVSQGEVADANGSESSETSVAIGTKIEDQLAQKNETTFLSERIELDMNRLAQQKAESNQDKDRDTDSLKNQDRLQQFNLELNAAIGDATGMFNTPVGKAVGNYLKLNQSWRNLERLRSEYDLHPTKELDRSIKAESKIVNNNVLDTIALTTEAIEPDLGKAVKSSVKLAKSWNELMASNQDYFENPSEQSRERFAKLAKQFRQDFRETLATTTSVIDPKVGKVLTNSLEIANQWDKLQELGQKNWQNPNDQTDLEMRNQAKKVLIEMSTAYLDLGGDQFSKQFKQQVKSYLNELWSVDPSESEQLQPEKIDLSKSQNNQSLPPSNQQHTALTKEKQIGLESTPARDRPHPMLAKIASFKKQPQQPTQAEPTWYGDKIKETAIALLNKYGQETRPGFTSTERDNYLISRQELGKRNHLNDSMSLRLGADCSRLSIFDFKNNRTILAVNFREDQSQQYFSRIDVNDHDKKHFQAFANQLKQLETRQQQRAIERQQQFEDSPRYGHAKEVARDLDLYLTNKGQKQTDNILTLNKDGFKLVRRDENNLEVTRNDGSLAFAVNDGKITQYDRNKLEDNLYKNIRAELKTNQVQLEPVSIEQQQRNQTRDYLGLTMRSYGMRDPHRNISYFQDNNLRMEHSYTHRTGAGFRHKLQVLDRTDNDRLILEYRAIEKSATIKSPDWLLEKEDLSSRNLKHIGKIGRETERLNNIRDLREAARAMVLEYGEREKGQLPIYGTYQNRDYSIEASRDRLVVRDRNSQRELLNCSNVPSDLRSEFTALANFQARDLEFFNQQHQQIQEHQRQRQQQQKLSRQRQLDRDRGMDMDL